MRATSSVLLLALMLSACQTEVYPEAPSVPDRVRTVVSSPNPSGTPLPSNGGSQLASTNGRFLEFLAAESKGKIFFAFYPLDENQMPITRPATSSGTVRLTDSTGKAQTKPLILHPTALEPYLYFFPDLSEGRTYQVKADLKVDGRAYSGDFTYRAR